MHGHTYVWASQNRAAALSPVDAHSRDWNVSNKFTDLLVLIFCTLQDLPYLNCACLAQL